MPTATQCIWNGDEISITQALSIKESETDATFLCLNCGKRVKAHAQGGHTAAHFEHHKRNPNCPYSHSSAYKYGGSMSDAYKNTGSYAAIEGYRNEQRYLASKRNIKLVTLRKEKDDHICQACKYNVKIEGVSIIDCHHINPLKSGSRVTSLDELVSLCPNCHRIAHTSEPPLLLKGIKEALLLAQTQK